MYSLCEKHCQPPVTPHGPNRTPAASEVNLIIILNSGASACSRSK